MYQQAEMTQHIGPLPPAAEVEKYSRVQKDYPERILRMAEKDQDNMHSLIHKQADHRQKLETKIVDAQISGNTRGQWFALVGLSMSFGAAILLQWLSAPVAVVIGVGGVGTISTVLGGFLRHALRRKALKKQNEAPPQESDDEQERGEE